MRYVSSAYYGRENGHSKKLIKVHVFGREGGPCLFLDTTFFPSLLDVPKDSEPRGRCDSPNLVLNCDVMLSAFELNKSLIQLDPNRLRFELHPQKYLSITMLKREQTWKRKRKGVCFSLHSHVRKDLKNEFIYINEKSVRPAADVSKLSPLQSHDYCFCENYTAFVR